MTCIVGIKTNSGVMFGADSLIVVNFGWPSYKGMKKIFTLPTEKDGGVLIGSCGSIRMHQLLEYSLTIPSRGNKSVHRFMCTDFIEAVRECFKDKGFSTVKDNEEKGGEFVVGYHRKLFRVHNDYQVFEVKDPIIAIGCGEGFALGAMWTAVHTGFNSKDVLKFGLQAAAYYDPGVGGPFKFKEVK